MGKRTKQPASSDDWTNIKIEDRKREKQKKTHRAEVRKHKLSEKKNFLSSSSLLLFINGNLDNNYHTHTHILT